MVHYFLRISSLSPSPMVSDEVDHRDTYVSRWSALKNLVTSETADVQPFVLVQINFCCAAPPL